MEEEGAKGRFLQLADSIRQLWQAVQADPDEKVRQDWVTGSVAGLLGRPLAPSIDRLCQRTIQCVGEWLWLALPHPTPPFSSTPGSWNCSRRWSARWPPLRTSSLCTSGRRRRCERRGACCKTSRVASTSSTGAQAGLAVSAGIALPKTEEPRDRRMRSPVPVPLRASWAGGTRVLLTSESSSRTRHSPRASG